MTQPLAPTPSTQDALRVQTTEQLRLLAARTDPKSPGSPPWAWVNLTADQAEWLDSALDEFVETYNRIHAGTVEDVIPACWRLDPPPGPGNARRLLGVVGPPRRPQIHRPRRVGVLQPAPARVPDQTP